jgi:hypothetical protein
VHHYLSSSSLNPNRLRGTSAAGNLT